MHQRYISEGGEHHMYATTHPYAHPAGRCSHMSSARGRGRPMRPGRGPWRAAGPGGGRARRGDVRAALLILLADERRNGYQLMQEIEQRSDGAWRPSPGSVYPALQQLEDEGLVTTGERDGRRVYQLTEAGRAKVADNDDDAPAPWDAVKADVGPGPGQLMHLVREVAM